MRYTALGVMYGFSGLASDNPAKMSSNVVSQSISCYSASTTQAKSTANLRSGQELPLSPKNPARSPCPHRPTCSYHTSLKKWLKQPPRLGTVKYRRRLSSSRFTWSLLPPRHLSSDGVFSQRTAQRHGRSMLRRPTRMS